MPVLLQVTDADKAYGEQVLLAGASFTLTDQMRVGVVGRNGAGKSTLCRVLLGQEELDSGQLHWMPGVRVAYLAQHDDWLPEETALTWLQRHSNQEAWRCGEVAGRFALKGSLLDGPVAALSGGWRTRVKLAGMLLAEPDLLVLDEPTNFLDLRTQLLLERFLSDWRGAALIVSHDRPFLEATCDHCLLVERGRLDLRPLRVSAALAAMAEERERLRRENSATQAKLAQLQRFVDRHRANANTASQAQNKVKQMERLELHAIEDDLARVHMRVPQVERRDGPALICRELAIGYPGHLVADAIDLEIQRGERVAVMGDNGQGKTTLLRSLAGSLPPQAGELRWSQGLDLGVYGQHVFGTLPEQQTVANYLRAAADDAVEDREVRAVAGSFLFSGDAFDKAINVLSGGERARMVLAGLLLARHSVLVLDEPTNHLDLETTEALAEALGRYAGTVLLVTHDRDFARQVASHVIEVADGRVRSFPGDIDLYLWRLAQEQRAAEQQTRPAQSTADHQRNGRRLFALQKAAAAAERRHEKLIAQLARDEAAIAELNDPEQLTTALTALAALRTGLDAAEEAWLQAQDALERLT